MLPKADFGCCNACGKPLTERRVSLNRLIEQYRYGPQETMEGDVLRDETVATYCSAECAWPAMHIYLCERDINYTGGSAGPVVPCAKCGGLLDMTQPHVAYVVRDETEQRTPWLNSIEVHSAEGVADVCLDCGGEMIIDAEIWAESVSARRLSEDSHLCSDLDSLIPYIPDTPSKA